MFAASARLAEEALKREANVSTAFEHGIAFPHARGVEGSGLTLSLGLSRRGIRFASDNRGLTRIVFFVAIPTAASAFYLRLLAGLTKTVLEAGLEAELAEHLGYERHEASGQGSGNLRSGTRAKTVLTDVGPVEVQMPRDRNGSFEPRIVRRRQRRLGGVDDKVISLTARGLTTGEVAAHLSEVYGSGVIAE